MQDESIHIRRIENATGVAIGKGASAVVNNITVLQQVGSAVGSEIAGPLIGAVMGNAAAYPLAAVLGELDVTGLKSAEIPPQLITPLQRANANALIEAFQDALSCAIVEIGADAFQADAHPCRQNVHLATCFSLASLRIDGSERDKIAVELLHNLHENANERVKIVSTPPYATSSEREAKQLFWDEVIRPLVASHTTTLPELIAHLKKHLFNRTLFHFSTRIQAQDDGWAGFHKLLVDVIHTQLQSLEATNQQILGNSEALLQKIERIAASSAEIVATLGEMQAENAELLSKIRQLIAQQSDELVERLNITERFSDLKVEIFDHGMGRIRNEIVHSREAVFQAPSLPKYVIERRELSAARQFVETAAHNCLVLTGLPGSGKTILATQIAHEQRANFPAGVVWLDLDSDTWDGVLGRASAAFGERNLWTESQTMREKIADIRHLLQTNKALVILDGVEDEQYLDDLIPTEGDSLMIITTRNRRLADLSDRLTLQRVRVFTFEDTQRFLHNALGEQPVTEARRLHQLLGGLPLALGMTVGLLKNSPLTLKIYNAALDAEERRLDKLHDESSSAINLRASFELSYQTLSPDAQALFVLLGFFRTESFSADACAALSQHDPVSVIQLLHLLETRSLISFEPELNRYSLHNLLRIYAREKGGERALPEQFITYFIHLAEMGDITTNPPFLPLEYDLPNLLLALTTCRQAGDSDLFMRGVLALTTYCYGAWGFLDLYGHWTTAANLLTEARHYLEQQPNEIAVRILLASAQFAQRLDRNVETADFLNVARQRIDETLTDERVLQHEIAARTASDLAAQRQQFEQAKVLLAQNPNPSLQAAIAVRLAGIYGQMGRFDAAEEQALFAQKQLPPHPTPLLTTTLLQLGLIAYYLGKREQSAEYSKQAYQSARTLSDSRQLSYILNNLSLVERDAGQFTNALNNLQNALTLLKTQGNDDTPYALGVAINIGILHTILGNFIQAEQTFTKLLAAAEQTNILAIGWSARADLYLTTEQFELARAAISTAYRHAQALGSDHLSATILRQRARWAIAIGNPKIAVPPLTIAYKLLFEQSDTTEALERGLYWRVNAALFVAQAKFREAADAYKNSIALLKPINEYELGITYWQQAQTLYDWDQELGRASAESALKIFKIFGLEHLSIQIETFLLSR